MAAQTDRLLAALRELNARLCERPDGPLVFLEYAAGLDRGWFVEVAERLQAAERVSCCLDVGHIGLRQAAAKFGDSHPGLNLKKLSPVDDRLPDLVADVQDAVGSALPHVLEVTRSLARLGKHVHFHLHDGHPLIPGLRDHFSFLTRLPIPFSYQGRRSLDMMYGPGGLASIVSAALEACPPQAVSFTLEIHQVEGRLPLNDAAWLFPHWQDTTNAERMNYWLSVLSENAMLISQQAGHDLFYPTTSLLSCDFSNQERSAARGYGKPGVACELEVRSGTFGPDATVPRWAMATGWNRVGSRHGVGALPGPAAGTSRQS